ncbi:MAG: ATP-grasp domain-containing protein [Patescibacteria group bacterium]|jgi:D-alanine-D-alanine ligase
MVGKIGSPPIPDMRDKHDNLVILYGGPSSEREVSFGTRSFFQELYKEFSPISIDWGTDSHFYVNEKKMPIDGFLDWLKSSNSVVIIASHGEFVEDGYIQKLFEQHHIPFTGSDSKSCELSMDKLRSQRKVSNLVQTVATSENYSDLEFPFIAKPNNLGSSVGVRLIKNKEELEEHLPMFSKDYIFQPYIKGTEISLGSVRENGGFMKLYPTEIIPKSEFFDYHAKYSENGSEEITPAHISNELTEELITINNLIHEELGLGYYSRSDYILSEDGTLYYLETNSLPGMTATSLVPQQLRFSNKLDDFKRGLIENLVIR